MDLQNRLPPQDLMIRTATKADAAAATSVLVLAFAADPMTRWSWPAAEAYLAHFPAAVRAFGGQAFDHGGAHLAEGGAALWLPPGSGPDEEALGSLLERTAPARIRGDIAVILQGMGRYHPSEPHWYLPLIGVDPARQGRGVGSALMRHALAACDRDRLPAYLESSNPANIPLYERHGFERLGAIQSGESPTVVPMLRRPRT
jgi:ribosomal protein S18 acetylase RimI-like enzyme